MSLSLIGVDCATQQSNIGLAFASFQNGKATVREVTVSSRTTPAVTFIKSWLAIDQTTLLALDAPLGWPIELGRSLRAHKAGERIQTGPDILFSRYTDREVWRRLDKKPLEVGANLIARTAHAALDMLGQLREETNSIIPLAWNPGIITETCAIEVYPRATLKAIGIKYEQRLRSMRELECITIDVADYTLTNEHAMDAIVCVLAATDFMTNKCLAPTKDEQKLAHKEGWIWLREYSDNQ